MLVCILHVLISNCIKIYSVGKENLYKTLQCPEMTTGNVIFRLLIPEILGYVTHTRSYSYETSFLDFLLEVNVSKSISMPGLHRIASVTHIEVSTGIKLLLLFHKHKQKVVMNTSVTNIYIST